jgi:hypothetical protein
MGLPIYKWRPRVMLYRHSKEWGWQFFGYIHPNYNPVIVVSWWQGYWFLQWWNWRWSNNPRFHQFKPKR